METQELYTKYIYSKRLLWNLNLHSVLLNWFSKFLVVYPLTDKELKIFNNLNGTSKKLGFLSRKLIKIAYEVNIPTDIIKYYYETKNTYKFYKNYKRKFKHTPDTTNIDKIVQYSFMRGREFERHNINMFKIHKITVL